LLTYLAVLPYESMLTAKVAATIDMISGRRFISGSAPPLEDRVSLSVSIDERNELFDERSMSCSLHWSGEKFSYETEARGPGRTPLTPTPDPIWIGATPRSGDAGTRFHGWADDRLERALHHAHRAAPTSMTSQLRCELKEMAAPTTSTS
jgi:alkanesulfonate monooxygenase SsuD/methylene tetrahydromethanopterin reductase-like flavin-dependent oxidoreductase (luciferase family)